MYQKAMPAGAAGYITPSYGMEAILKPVEPVQEEEQQPEPQQPEPASPDQTPNPGQE